MLRDANQDQMHLGQAPHKQQISSTHTEGVSLNNFIHICH